MNIGFIGLGLIGGSIAKALKENTNDIHITVYDINEDSLSKAKEDGVADITTTAIDESFSSCDIIFLCAPVQKNAENVAALKTIISPNCILTDVGSVKTDITKCIEEHGITGNFIGGHPMAGSERYGYANSKASLLENAYYILTPNENTSTENLDKLKELVTLTGAIPLIIDHKMHDYVTAGISHLPHVIAASLVNLVKSHDNEDEIMKTVAAGGFKDITRIASSNATMWQEICLTNGENISALLADYITSLCDIKASIDAGDAKDIYDFFDEARIYRDSFISASSGPIKICYDLTVDISDETGALASIATILALKQISIKNIGIVHNRESQTGALRIEFYDEDGLNAAKDVLTLRGYTIYAKKL